MWLSQVLLQKTSLALVQTSLQVIVFWCDWMWMNVNEAAILILFQPLVPKRSCGIIPAVAEVQQFSTTWKSGSSFRDLMWVEKLLDTIHSDDDDDDSSALLDKWRLSARVWEPWCTALITIGFIIHTRRVRADLTAICLFDHVAPQPGSRHKASIAGGEANQSASCVLQAGRSRHAGETWTTSGHRCRVAEASCSFEEAGPR